LNPAGGRHDERSSDSRSHTGLAAGCGSLLPGGALHPRSAVPASGTPEPLRWAGVHEAHAEIRPRRRNGLQCASNLLNDRMS
jgi:hypothetical protein